MWYTLLPATSLVFSSLLSLPSTVPSTTKQHEQKVGKWGIQEKTFQWTSKCSSLVVCGLSRVEKSKICKICLLAAFYHFGASRRAVIAWSLTFEPRLIEHWSWWQNCPISCALQLFFWGQHLKTNILDSRPAIMKMYKIRRNGRKSPKNRKLHLKCARLRWSQN